MSSEIIRKLKKPASIINGLSRLAQHQEQISVEQLLMLLRQTVSHCFETLLGLVIQLLYMESLHLCGTITTQM
jgi:hypothetical protein